MWLLVVACMVHGPFIYASAFAVVIVLKSVVSALLQILYSLNQSFFFFNVATASWFSQVLAQIVFCCLNGQPVRDFFRL